MPGAQGETANGYEVPGWGARNILELDRGDGCTTLSVHQTARLYTCKCPNAALGL